MPIFSAISPVQEVAVDITSGVAVVITITFPTPETQGVTYVGRLLVVRGNGAAPPGMRGTNYHIGIFAREGDTETLARAEQTLASLRFT